MCMWRNAIRARVTNAAMTVATVVATGNAPRGVTIDETTVVVIRVAESIVSRMGIGIVNTDDQAIVAIPVKDAVTTAGTVGARTGVMVRTVMTIARRTDAAGNGTAPAVAIPRARRGHHSQCHPLICPSHPHYRQTNAL
jgi:hypothetical protein